MATEKQLEYFKLCQAQKTLEKEGLIDSKNIKKDIEDKKKEKLPKDESLGKKAVKNG